MLLLESGRRTMNKYKLCNFNATVAESPWSQPSTCRMNSMTTSGPCFRPATPRGEGAVRSAGRDFPIAG